jgi:hypothetical protein
MATRLVITHLVLTYLEDRTQPEIEECTSLKMATDYVERFGTTYPARDIERVLVVALKRTYEPHLRLSRVHRPITTRREQPILVA